MLAYGSDRVHISGEKIDLVSAAPKGWRPRVRRTATSAEHPGTAVLWDERIFEVVRAEGMESGAVRYQLEPWRDEHAIRTLERYDEASESERAADLRRVARQHRHRGAAQAAAMLLGHFPAPVQNHLASELGLSAPGMTILSTLPGIVLMGVCAGLFAGAVIAQKPSAVPLWLGFVAVFFTLDALIRFFVAMSQSRAIGSIPGFVLYALLWACAPARLHLVPPFAARGERLFSIAPDPALARREAAYVRAPLLTLLSADDQRLLAKTCGFDYRRTARPVAWVILVAALAGIGTVWTGAVARHRISAMLSLAVASAAAGDQVIRLVRLRSGPAPSIFAPLLRRFARDLLEPCA